MFKCQQSTHAIFSNNHVMFICGDWQDSSIIKNSGFLCDKYTRHHQRKWSRGPNLDIWAILHPQEEKLGYYFQSGTCFGTLETHILLSFGYYFQSGTCFGALETHITLRSVTNINLLTLKLAVHKIQD